MDERILVLDDEQSILEILGQHLGNEGYSCELASSAVAAIEELKAEPFSLLMTDLKMPEMHGIEVVQQAKAIDPDLAIIVVTALIEATSAVEAMRAGADDYVTKPFNLGEISLSVERALERRRLVIENRRYQTDLEMRVREATQGLEDANRELRGTKDYLERLLHSTMDAIVTVNEEGHITYANQGALEMLGRSEADMKGTPADRIVAGGGEELRYLRRMLRRDRLIQSYETELRHADGRQVPVNISLSCVNPPEGGASAVFAICKDITPQKQLENELKEMSIKDSLTSLYNQRYFYDRLESEIERARRQRHPLSLLLFDIDQFKTYNDCHGHLEGDKVLRAVGQMVIECTREHVDIGFRYGGDEFTVILPEADEEQARAIAERIRATFEARRFDHLTLSSGLMSYKEGSSLRSFIRFTDAMMYDAKRSGGNQVYVFKPDAAEEEEQLEANTERESP